MAETINELIDKLVQEKTFSLDAVQAVAAIRDRADLLSQQLEHANSISKDRLELIKSQEKSITKLEEENLRLREAAVAVAEREKKIFELEKREAVSTACAETVRQCFETVFKPNTLRESIQRSVNQPVTYPGGRSGWQTSGEIETKTTEEGS